MNRFQLCCKKTAIATIFTTAIALSSFGLNPKNAQAQKDPFADSTSLPLSLTLEELDGSWRKFSISGQYDMADLLKAWTSLFGGAVSYSNVYFTQGKTTTTAGQTYLVAYRVPLSGRDLDLSQLFAGWGMTGSQENGCDALSEFITPPLTMQSEISLALLNPTTIGSLNDIRTLDVAAEIQASEKRHNALLESCREQELRAVSAEAKQTLGSIHRAQQAYQFENVSFTPNISELGIGEFDEENYRYFISIDSPRFVSTQAIATSETGFNLVGGVAVVDNGGPGLDYTLSILCEATEAGGEIPAAPTFNPQTMILSCPAGTRESY
ncbi:MAG: type IV pilin-like G/H family protein [Limnothrix sp.]